MPINLSLSESGLGHAFRAGGTERRGEREFISAGTSQSKVERQRQSESSISRFSFVKILGSSFEVRGEGGGML